jgi:hypothetical protein
MGRLRKVVRFILGPNFLSDRPADQSRLTAGPLAGSERMIDVEGSPEQAGDAARDVRRRGNSFGR